MPALRRVVDRLFAPWRSARIKREIAEELRFHVDARTAENVRAGMAAEEARREAMRRFGPATLIAEEGFDVRGAAWWDEIVADVRYAVRLLLKHKAFAALALAAMALGTGANIAIYSALNAVIVRPLPFARPGQLVVVRQQQTKAERDDLDFSVVEMEDYRNGNRTLTGLAEYFVDEYVLQQEGAASERVQTAVVSSNFFDLFGVQPAMGRSFAAADERPGAPPVVVLAHDYWERSQHGDPGVIGRTLRLNDMACTVVGVLPPLPPYPDDNDLYLTTTSSAFRMWPERISNRNRRFARLFGRMKPGVALRQVNDDLAIVSSRLERQYPGIYPPELGYKATAAAVDDEVTRRARGAIWLLTGAALFILATVCANVANMTLARLAQREQELAMRVALGATGGRIFRQLLTETVVLSVIATAIGLLLALAGSDLVRRLLVDLTPRAREIAIDRAALAFSLLMTAVTSAATAGIVALSTRRQRLAPANGGRHFTAGARQARMRTVLVGAQVAFSLALLSGAGMMVRSFVNLQRVDAGVARDAVLTMHLDFSATRYPVPANQRTAARAILRDVTALPGVISAAASSSFPLDPITIAFGIRGDWNRYQVLGVPLRAGQSLPVSIIRFVSTDYFATLGIPLLRGRVFLPGDREGAERVVIVNQAFARHRLAARADPLGARISSDGGKTWLTIAGIVGDTAERDLRDRRVDEVYFPLEQLAPVPSGEWVRTLTIRSRTEPAALANQVRKAIGAAAPDIALSHVLTLEQARSRSMTSQRVMTGLLAVFAGIALVVAVSGVGGMVALSVNQRVKEIGLRRTLGAQSSDIAAMVLRREMTAVAFGLVAGGFVVAGLAGSFRTFLFDMTPADPATIAAVCAIFAGAALAACYVPVTRALRVDPGEVLRL